MLASNQVTAIKDAVIGWRRIIIEENVLGLQISLVNQVQLAEFTLPPVFVMLLEIVLDCHHWRFLEGLSHSVVNFSGAFARHDIVVFILQIGEVVL